MNIGAIWAQVKMNFSLISRGGLPGPSLGDFAEGRGEELIITIVLNHVCWVDKDSQTFAGITNSAWDEFNLKNSFWLIDQ